MMEGLLNKVNMTVLKKDRLHHTFLYLNILCNWRTNQQENVCRRRDTACNLLNVDPIHIIINPTGFYVSQITRNQQCTVWQKYKIKFLYFDQYAVLYHLPNIKIETFLISLRCQRRQSIFSSTQMGLKPAFHFPKRTRIRESFAQQLNWMTVQYSKSTWSYLNLWNFQTEVLSCL